MILATWYKQALRESLLGQVYVNQKKLKGVEVDDKEIKEKVYEQYLEAFKKGVYNYIKEDEDPAAHKMMSRKYFSGGAGFETLPAKMKVIKGDLNSSSVGVHDLVAKGFRHSIPA